LAAACAPSGSDAFDYAHCGFFLYRLTDMHYKLILMNCT
jgi:hypothetical protein